MRRFYPLTLFPSLAVTAGALLTAVVGTAYLPWPALLEGSGVSLMTRIAAAAMAMALAALTVAGLGAWLRSDQLDGQDAVADAIIMGMAALCGTCLFVAAF